MTVTKKQQWYIVVYIVKRKKMARNKTTPSKFERRAISIWSILTRPASLLLLLRFFSSVWFSFLFLYKYIFSVYIIVRVHIIMCTFLLFDLFQILIETFGPFVFIVSPNYGTFAHLRFESELILRLKAKLALKLELGLHWAFLGLELGSESASGKGFGVWALRS